MALEIYVDNIQNIVKRRFISSMFGNKEKKLFCSKKVVLEILILFR